MRKLTAREYDMMTTEEYTQYILDWIDSGEPLDEDIYKELIWEWRVDEKTIEKHRWVTVTEVIMKIGDRYFSGGYDEANTEMQENYYYPETLIEVKPVEKVITITEYVPINETN